MNYGVIFLTALIILLFLWRPEIGVYLVSLIVPIWNPFLAIGGAHLFLNITILIIVSVIVIVKYICYDRNKLIASDIILPTTFFLLSILISAFINQIEFNTLYPEILRYLFIWLFVIIAANLINSKKQLLIIIILLTISVTLRSIWELIIFWEQPILQYRLGPDFLGPNPFGGLVSVVLLLLLLLRDHLYGYRKLIIAPVMIVLISTLMATFSRGSLIGFLVGILLFCFSSLRSFMTRSYIILLIMIIYVVICVMFPDTIERAESALTLEGLMSRTNLYQECLQLVIDHPVFGVGPGNIFYYLRFHIDDTPIRSAHNMYLHVQSELGVLGFLAYISLIITIYLKGFTIYKNSNDNNVKRFTSAVIIIFTNLMVLDLSGNFSTLLQTCWIYSILIGSMYSMWQNPSRFFRKT